MSGWTIKARMASKDSLRSFSRGSETISVFTCELVDDQVCALKPLLKVLEACSGRRQILAQIAEHVWSKFDEVLCQHLSSTTHMQWLQDRCKWVVESGAWHSG